MKKTLVGVFSKPLAADETVRLLVKAGFCAERIPRPDKELPKRAAGALLSRLVDKINSSFEAFMDADMYLSPFSRALSRGCFVVKVYTSGDNEAHAARTILEIAGAAQIDALADEWVEG